MVHLFRVGHLYHYDDCHCWRQWLEAGATQCQSTHGTLLGHTHQRWRPTVGSHCQSRTVLSIIHTYCVACRIYSLHYQHVGSLLYWWSRRTIARMAQRLCPLCRARRGWQYSQCHLFTSIYIRRGLGWNLWFDWRMFGRYCHQLEFTFSQIHHRTRRSMETWHGPLLVGL